MTRDNRTCAYCGAPASVIDHIKPVAEGGSDRDAKLAACCRSCNEKKRVEEAKRGRQRQMGGRVKNFTAHGPEPLPNHSQVIYEFQMF